MYVPHPPTHAYDDIIDLPRPVSKLHKPMSMRNRAAQFSPFSALTGYEAVIEETGYQAEQFALIHPGGAVGERLNNKAL